MEDNTMGFTLKQFTNLSKRQVAILEDIQLQPGQQRRFRVRKIKNHANFANNPPLFNKILFLVDEGAIDLDDILAPVVEEAPKEIMEEVQEVMDEPNMIDEEDELDDGTEEEDDYSL